MAIELLRQGFPLQELFFSDDCSTIILVNEERAGPLALRRRPLVFLVFSFQFSFSALYFEPFQKSPLCFVSILQGNTLQMDRLPIELLRHIVGKSLSPLFSVSPLLTLPIDRFPR